MVPLTLASKYHAFALVKDENGDEAVISKAELVEENGRLFRKAAAKAEERREERKAQWTPPAWAVAATTPQPHNPSNQE